jgi:hypothetical protein
VGRKTAGGKCRVRKRRRNRVDEGGAQRETCQGEGQGPRAVS